MDCDDGCQVFQVIQGEMVSTVQSDLPSPILAIGVISPDASEAGIGLAVA